MSNNNNQGGKKNKKNNKKGGRGDEEEQPAQQTPAFTFDSGASKQVNFNFSTADTADKPNKGSKKAGQQQPQQQQQQQQAGGKKGKKQPEPEPEEEEEDEEEEGELAGGENVDFAELHKRIQEQLDNEIKQKTEAFLASLSPAVQQRVKVIQHFQDKIKELREEYEKELKALSQKYEKLYQPFNQKRTEIVSGDRDPTSEELNASIKEGDKSLKSDQNSKGIPDFWLTVLQNHPTFDEMIQERDQAALKYLRDITAEEFEKEDKEGFIIHFHFNENPFFNNKELTKTYTVIDEQGQLLIDSVEGTEIDWKEDQNLTVNKIKKKQRHKSGKGTRVVIKTEPCDSFFNFFKTPEDDEAMDELLEAEYDLGQTLKEDILPEVVDWYLGAVSPLMPFGEDDDYDDEDGDDDEDRDEDDEDEDDEEEEEKPKSKGANKGGNKKGGQQGPAGQQGENPECKQQ